MVHTEVVLDKLDDLINEKNILATVVGPPVVEAIRGDEDSTALRTGLEAVPWLNADSIDNVIHGATSPMEAKDKVVWITVIISVGDEEAELAAIDVVNAGSESRLVAATG